MIHLKYLQHDCGLQTVLRLYDRPRQTAPPNLAVCGLYFSDPNENFGAVFYTAYASYLYWNGLGTNFAFFSLYIP